MADQPNEVYWSHYGSGLPSTTTATTDFDVYDYLDGSLRSGVRLYEAGATEPYKIYGLGLSDPSQLGLALKECLNDIKAGERIQLGPGSYQTIGSPNGPCFDANQPNHDGIIIEGVGAILKPGPDNIEHNSVLEVGDNVSVTGIKVDGLGEGSNIRFGIGIKATGNDVTIQNVEVYNTHSVSGLSQKEIGAGIAVTGDRVRIISSQVHDCLGPGIYSDGANGLSVKFVEVTDCECTILSEASAADVSIHEFSDIVGKSTSQTKSVSIICDSSSYWFEHVSIKRTTLDHAIDGSGFSANFPLDTHGIFCSRVKILSVDKFDCFHGKNQIEEYWSIELEGAADIVSINNCYLSGSIKVGTAEGTTHITNNVICAGFVETYAIDWPTGAVVHITGNTVYSHGQTTPILRNGASRPYVFLVRNNRFVANADGGRPVFASMGFFDAYGWTKIYCYDNVWVNNGSGGEWLKADTKAGRLWFNTNASGHLLWDDSDLDTFPAAGSGPYFPDMNPSRPGATEPTGTKIININWAPSLTPATDIGEWVHVGGNWEVLTN